MSLQSLTRSFPWQRYSKKLCVKIEQMLSAGFFTPSESEQRGMHLAVGEAGSKNESHFVRFYWLVDKDDGIIVDARYQMFGQSPLIAAAEIACHLVIGKNYDEVSKITADEIDKQGRDRKEIPSFPEEAASHLNLIISALDATAESCREIPLSPSYVQVPNLQDSIEVLEGGYAGWEALTKDQKLKVIEEVIAREVRPYIELDAGGIEILDLLNDSEVRIAYLGSCTTCFASTGSTLFYIQKVLQGKVHPSLTVTPEF